VRAAAAAHGARMTTTDTNIATIERMTQAIFDQDHATLASLFTDDYVFHLRGPVPVAGDHQGVAGMVETIGWVFEQTNGDIKLNQTYCVPAGAEWASEREHATLGRNGKTLEVDNLFSYRFDGGRIAEMWFYFGATSDEADAFFA
jgi:ketosteroid isomerase-like protein